MVNEKIGGWEQKPKTKEKKNLSEQELANKVVEDFFEIKKELSKQINNDLQYLDKNGKDYRISLEKDVIIIRTWISDYDKNWKFKDLKPLGKVQISFSNWQFYVNTRTPNSKTNIQDWWVKLKPSEAWEYTDAVKKRVTACKNAIKDQFINLSVIQTKQEADNLIENIEAQTA